MAVCTRNGDRLAIGVCSELHFDRGPPEDIAWPKAKKHFEALPS